MDDVTAESNAMTDDDLRGIVRREIGEAMNYYGTRLESRRTRALKDYFGEPYGDERVGRSQVTTRTLFEIVEWMIPDLMDIFTSGNEVAQFSPTGPEDEEAAQQQGDVANFVFLRQNNGEQVIQTLAKDGLLSITGIVKTTWRESVETVTETWEGLTDFGLMKILDDESTVEPVAYESYSEAMPDGSEMPLHRLTVKRREKNGRVHIENVPPEEFGLSRDAKSVKDARFVYHRVRTTEADLIAQGFDAAEVEKIPTSSGDDLSRDAQRDARASMEDGTAITDAGSRTDSAREVVVFECYVRVDYDGDGVTELRRVTIGGENAAVILENEEVESAPFSAWTPIMVPHRFYGLSMADVVADIQRIETTVLRQYLDGIYLANNPRYAVTDGQVELDELLLSVPGGYVTERVPGAVRPLATLDVTGTALPALEYLRDARENRTGITRYNQGTNAKDSLNKTATGISLIQNAASKRIAMIARNLAGAILDIFEKIVDLLMRHQDVAMTVRLRGQWVEVDPSQWDRRLDAAISVGLGSGNRDARVANATQILSLQQQVMEAGLGGVLVTPEHAYNALCEAVQALGYKSPERFFASPENAEPQEEPPDLKLVEIESREKIEQQKLMLEAEKIRLEHEWRMAQIGARTGVEIAKLGGLNAVD